MVTLLLTAAGEIRLRWAGVKPPMRAPRSKLLTPMPPEYPLQPVRARPDEAALDDEIGVVEGVSADLILGEPVHREAPEGHAVCPDLETIARRLPFRRSRSSGPC